MNALNVIGKGRGGIEQQVKLSGTKLVETNVAVQHCGTYGTGWLLGGHPTLGEGVVDRTVKFNWKSYTADIKVVNCNTHFVYYLVDVPVCSLGYCTE